jgi:hypothetical protein
VPVQCWDIQRHLGIREPVGGFGRLIAEMPASFQRSHDFAATTNANVGIEGR